MKTVLRLSLILAAVEASFRMSVAGGVLNADPQKHRSEDKTTSMTPALDVEIRVVPSRVTSIALTMYIPTIR